ncbi:4-hydroxy-tetrahydrodipicolinate synthase [Conexibacter sp. DBS9H8]|uniref:4-hydroxy-tetrahydrodipicolinate synthase family protein n=1 Tax=Conexibacter sp. DBS9H8 TaxID=2937801 RepID=UPI0020105A23|nr:4-hydroxy-tetrahydrodipicolinate synthase [Conexibacter sp. DBS9H8]
MSGLGTILTAMVTPFDASGAVDEPAAARLLAHLFATGSDGVVVCGTTGEAATLDDAEHLGFIAFVIEQTRRHHPGKTVVAGVGSNDTRHAVALTAAATELRPDALLSVNPYYNRPSRAGVVAHYREVNAATDLPVMLYNIPQRTGADLPNDLLAELAQFEHVAAVKQANPANLALIDGLELYAGNDENLVDVLALGGAGGVLTLSHIFGAEFRQIADDPARREQVHASLADAYRDMAIAPLAVTNKAALSLLGIDVGGPRLPYVPLDAAERDVIRRLLERHGRLSSTGVPA